MTSTTTRRPYAGTGVRIPPRARQSLLTVHIAGAAGLIGVDLVLVTLGAAGLGGAGPETVYPAMALVARIVLVPLAAVALVSGVLQAYLLGYGLASTGWVTTKLVITSLLTIAAVLVVVPGLGRAAAAATSPDRPVTTAQQVVSTVTPSIAGALLVLSTALAVYKPRRRSR